MADLDSIPTPEKLPTQEELYRQLEKVMLEGHILGVAAASEELAQEPVYSEKVRENVRKLTFDFKRSHLEAPTFALNKAVRTIGEISSLEDALSFQDTLPLQLEKALLLDFPKILATEVDLSVKDHASYINSQHVAKWAALMGVGMRYFNQRKLHIGYEGPGTVELLRDGLLYPIGQEVLGERGVGVSKQLRLAMVYPCGPDKDPMVAIGATTIWLAYKFNELYFVPDRPSFDEVFRTLVGEMGFDYFVREFIEHHPGDYTAKAAQIEPRLQPLQMLHKMVKHEAKSED